MANVSSGIPLIWGVKCYMQLCILLILQAKIKTSRLLMQVMYILAHDNDT